MKCKLFILAIISLSSITLLPNRGNAQADVCKVTRNYFDGDGGTSGANSVKGSDGGKTIVMETDFETITIKLGSIPTTTAEFTIINYVETPGSDQLSVKIYNPSGNEVDTYDYNDDKTAFLCNDGKGKLTITWKGVIFKQTANAKMNIKTSIEVTASGYTNTSTTTNANSNDGGNITNNNTNTTTETAPVDPDAALKSEIANYETQLAGYTKNITAKEYELNEKKSKNQIDSVDAVIAKYDIDILNLKRDETKLALERSQKTLDKKLSIDDKQSFISKEEQCRLKAKSLETDRNKLVETKTANMASKKAVTDYTASVSMLESEIKTISPVNRLDSLNLNVKKYELEKNKAELEKNKSIAERTDKALKGRLTEKAAQEYANNENNYQLKITESNNRIAEQQKLIKEENKKAKKDLNKAKLDAQKVKVKLKLATKEVASKEKSVAKYKKKNDTEKLAKAETELAEAKKKQSDLQKELDELNAIIKKK